MLRRLPLRRQRKTEMPVDRICWGADDGAPATGFPSCRPPGDGRAANIRGTLPRWSSCPTREAVAEADQRRRQKNRQVLRVGVT
jgi:hypothetical protein